MSLAYNLSKAVFLGNGISTVFPFNFKVWNKEQLQVFVTDNLGNEKATTNYSVELSENGGTVNYLHNLNDVNIPLPNGYKLSILRNMPFIQEVDLISGTRFDPEVIETQLDQATAERQQLREALERSIKTNTSADISPEEFTQKIFTAHSETVQRADEVAQNTVEVAQNTAQVAQNTLSASNSENSAKHWAEEAQKSAAGAQYATTTTAGLVQLTQNIGLVASASDKNVTTEKAVAAVVDFVKEGILEELSQVEQNTLSAVNQLSLTAQSADAKAQNALNQTANKLALTGGTLTGALNLGSSTITDTLRTSNILALKMDSDADYLYFQGIRNRANFDDISLIINRLYGGGAGTVSLLNISPLSGIGSAAFSQRIPAPVPTNIQMIGHIDSVGIGGNSYGIPTGGTYMYFIIGFGADGTYIGTRGGFAAGGTPIIIEGATKLSVFAWRIA